MTLTGHVTAEHDENRGAESKFIGAKHCRDHYVACGAQTAIGAQTDATTKAIVNEDLLCFRKSQFPRIPRVLDARKRAGAGAASVAGNDDVVSIGLGNARGDGADSATGDKLDADCGARIGTLRDPR